MPGNEVGVPDKMTVFQRCVSSFNRSSLSADEARNLLTQLVHLFYVGDTFLESEATQLFFTITKLFQKESAGLKQVVYLAIKELVPLTDNVIMGTSVLMRDVQQAHNSPDSAMYRPQALRALCRILDAGAVEGMDRLMRSAIVDKDQNFASAALVSSYHLLGIARDNVKRWATEIQEACGSPTITQYHALGLLHEVRQHDPMALLKLVISLADQHVLVDVSAQSLHVRFVGELLEDQPKQPQLLAILRSYLYNRSDIVALEAAKTVLNVPLSDEENVHAAIGVLRAYLESPRATSRFAAIRALNRYAGVNPELVATCNDEIEQLITDGNQSIATYAITALLKTGSESSVDSLIDRITNILRDIPDDFRLVVVDAVRNLAKRFPEKHDRMLDFFSETLQHHGHFDLKLAIVEAISDVLHANSAPESLNNALMMLCETIEDSEYPEVTIRVLHLLGAIGPAASKPSTYVRFIYNRVILENSVVRAAAISALAKFSDVVPGPKQLVSRSLKDPNDEVRDRAAIAFVADASSLPRTKLAMADLESKLLAYLNNPEAQTQEFDASNVQQIRDEDRTQSRLVTEAAAQDEEVAPGKKSKSGSASGSGSGAGSAIVSSGESVDYASELAKIPEIANLPEIGKLERTAFPQKLTDDDMEYVVVARVHVFPKYLVVQYDIQNNYELDLTDVHVENTVNEDVEEHLEVLSFIPASELAPNSKGTAYTVIKYDITGLGYDTNGTLVGSLSTLLRFKVDGSDDEYPIDDLKIRPAEYITAIPSSPQEFEAMWQNSELEEQQHTIPLMSCANLNEAFEFITSKLGMANCGSIPLSTDPKASILLRGRSVFFESDILVKVQLIKSSSTGVVGKFIMKSSEADNLQVVSDGLY